MLKVLPLLLVLACDGQPAASSGNPAALAPAAAAPAAPAAEREAPKVMARQAVIDGLAAFAWKASHVDVLRIDGNDPACAQEAARHEAELGTLAEGLKALPGEEERLSELLRIARICAGCLPSAWDTCGDIPKLTRELGATREEGLDEPLPAKTGAARATERKTLLKAIRTAWKRVPDRCRTHPGVFDDDIRGLAYKLKRRASALAPADDNVAEAADMLRACAECSRNQSTYCGRTLIALERAEEEPDGREYRSVWD